MNLKPDQYLGEINCIAIGTIVDHSLPLAVFGPCLMLFVCDVSMQRRNRL